MSWAGRYVGLPFRSGGRGPEDYDCWGLVRGVYRDVLGIELPSYGEVTASSPERSRAIRRGSEGAEWVPVAAPRALDVAVMRDGAGRRYAHVGVMMDERHVLHVEEACHAVIEPVTAARIKHRIMGYWRHEAA